MVFWRQCGTAAFCATLCAGLLLGGCGESRPPVGAVGNVVGFTGGAAADEPRAVTVASDVLSAGGTAADAAVSLYFTLAATYPLAASLGGGGVCLVFDAPTGTAESVEFLPRPPVRGGSVAVPGSVRAMSALHARYGRLRWEQLVAPAENMARFGHPISRALARGIRAFAKEIETDQGLANLFKSRAGGLLREGEGFLQIELASTLSLLRTRGSGDFHAGLSARNFVEASRRLGGAVSVEDLRNYLPVWRDAAKFRFGDLTLHFAPPPVGGGMLAGQMWAMLMDGNRVRVASASERPHLFAEVSMRAFADRKGAAAGANQISVFRAHTLMTTYDAGRHVSIGLDPPSTPAAGSPSQAVVPGADGSTSFVVADREGSAVACALTMNAPFGTGGWDRLTGIIPALALAPADSAAAFLGPILVVREQVDELVFAGAASGGNTAPAALMQTSIGVLLDGMSLNAAIDGSRMFHAGVTDYLVYERALSHEALDALDRRGHKLRPVDQLGIVNAIHCPGGLENLPESCAFRADSRGFGLSVSQFPGEASTARGRSRRR